jgi:hypothetical protein
VQGVRPMGHRTATDNARPDMPTWLAEQIIEERVWPKAAGFDNSDATERELWILKGLVKSRRHLEALQAQVDTL